MNSFQDLRQNAHLSRSACADYLKVDLSTINRWDNGRSPAPFAVCELMKVVAGKLPQIALSSAFNGWTYQGEYLYTPEGDRFTAGDIRELFILRQQLRAYRVEVKELKTEINVLSKPKGITASNVVLFPQKKTNLKQG